MRKTILGLMMACCLPVCHGQTPLTLDSCRAMAVRNNRQINIARLKKEMALNIGKAAKTHYLPKVDVVGGYEWTSREISILSDTRQSQLANLGTLGLQHVSTDIVTGLTDRLTGLVQQGLITAEQAGQLGELMKNMKPGPIGRYLETTGNTLGEELVRSFRTDTRNVFGGAVMLRQPIYMGGAIIATNRMADIAGRMADDDLSAKTQATLYEIDQAYWTVVSLRQKEKLAADYRELVGRLDNDVQKMIEQGVATRADGLKVRVKVNEADMQRTKVENGLVLAKMLLCQLCGLPLNREITLADEGQADIPLPPAGYTDALPDSTLSSRPEVRLLQNTVALSEQSARLIRAAYLPHVALTGGYMMSNPNVFNGFQKKFSGVWTVGVLVQVPLWNWNEGAYKVRAARTAGKIAQTQLQEAREKITLQIEQCRFRLSEARKQLRTAEQNIQSAEENLRSARVGFREGVIGASDVMAAQTAWQQAQSRKIDAAIALRMDYVNLQKALGTLHE